LNAYVKSNIYTRPDDIQKVISKLDGWFACTVMTNKYVDVFKESQSQLYFCKSKEINYIYCTSEHILNMALKRYDIDHTKVNAVPCNTLLRHNVMTGDIISSYKFEVNERKKYVFDDDKTWYKNYKKSVKYLELFK
jgi:cytolysin (calcineurin-like family phosphatase)